MEVHTIQFEITIGKHAKIYLNDRKYQISSKIFETLPQQHICRLLLVKKASEIPTIKNRNTNYSCILHSKLVLWEELDILLKTQNTTKWLKIEIKF